MAEMLFLCIQNKCVLWNNSLMKYKGTNSMLDLVYKLGLKYI